LDSTLRSPANVFSDQGSDGSSRQVPYDDIEANPADYYDISKYDKNFIKNPLRPDADIMELASMALTLRKDDFNFYDPEVIQANILSHAQLVAQGAKELEGGDGSASEIIPEGDGEDVRRSDPLSGEETEKEEGEEAGQVGRLWVGNTPSGNSGGKGDDGNTEANAEREREGEGDGQDATMQYEGDERASERDDHVQNMEANAGERGREGEDQDAIMEDRRSSEGDNHDENMEGDAEEEGREGEDQGVNTEDADERERDEQDKSKEVDAEREREGASEDMNSEGEHERVSERAREEEDGEENIEGEEEDKEVEGRIGSGDRTGLPGEDSTKRKSRKDKKKPTATINMVRDSSGAAVSGSIVHGTRGRQTRGTKRKAELEGVRTTRSKVPKLSVNARQPVYRRRKIRRL
jgi:hypothetical protein